MPQETSLSSPSSSRTIAFSSIIAIGAVAQTCMTFWLANREVNWALSGIIGICTFMIYYGHHLLQRRLPKSLYTASGLVALILLYIMGRIIHPAIAIGFFILILLVLSYYQPWSRHNHQWITLRQKPQCKIWLIASVWSLTVVGLPALNDWPHLQWILLVRFLEHFVFILTITLPFDIRDYHQDLNAGLRTWPHQLGIQKAWKRCRQLVLTHMLCVVIGYWGKVDWLLAYFLVDLFIWYLLHQKRLKTSPLYYYVLLDGTLFLQPTFIYLFHLL
jgi:4-hydroxybenzoate polyprenyltransferase